MCHGEGKVSIPDEEIKRECFHCRGKGYLVIRELSGDVIKNLRSKPYRENLRRPAGEQ